MQTVGDWQYERKDFLGAGSFGQVYKAKHSKTGERVALKILDMKFFKDQYMVEALKNEIKVMKMLTSPNVVHIVEVFQNPAKTQTYMVIELCDCDLRALLNRKGYLPQDQALQVFTQLMKGFEDLVKHNYVHRDVKPENALVKGNVFKVADFGFATKIDISGHQLLKEQVGTPIYMSPQILHRDPYGAKTDIWSIGMMFYEMLFGKTPWSCRDMHSLLRNIKTQPLKFPYERPISDAMKDFLKRCLTIEEAGRIGWKEVFAHEVFNPIQQQPQKSKQPELNEQCVRILRKLQDVVRDNNIDPKFVFQRFDANKDNRLDHGEFSELIKAIDPKILQANVNQLFERIGNKQAYVDFKEFQCIFNEFDFTDLSDRAGNIIKDIQEIIKANNINMAQIFKQFDFDKQGTLNMHEFSNFIKSIVPGLKEHEIKLIFDKFDRDQNGTISYAEFQYIISKGTGQTQRDELTKRAQDGLRKLQHIVKSNNLDVSRIFMKFDKSGDKMIDGNEFCELMRAIDKNISKNEVAAIFHLFDKNADDVISYHEFKQMF